MPESIDIKASTGDYRVIVGDGFVEKVLYADSNAIFLVDSYIANNLSISDQRVVRVPALETSKALENIAPIIANLRELGANRDTSIFAVGGGIIQDIATFVASIYMRGVRWSYLPTTLLGMVDSCVGGKSSINVYGYKNLVGNFYPPDEVIIDLGFLQSLSTEQIISGLIEAAKICYARSPDDFNGYLHDVQEFDNDGIQLERIIVRSLRCKQWFIEVDEFDKNERLLLNYGHTFGHALEAGSEFRVSHGVAVGFGILAAAAYAERQALLTPKGLQRIGSLIEHLNMLLARLPQLAQELAGLDVNVLMEKFESDKKHRKDKYRIVVPAGDGLLQIEEVPRSEAGKSTVMEAYSSAINMVSDLY